MEFNCGAENFRINDYTINNVLLTVRRSLIVLRKVYSVADVVDGIADSAALRVGCEADARVFSTVRNYNL